jgi:hypothetical protein
VTQLPHRRFPRSLAFACASLTGPVAGAVVLAVDASSALSRDMAYRGEAMLTERWLAIGLIIICPVLCGLSATDSALLGRPGTAHLNSVRGGLRYRWALRWSVGPALAAHALVFAAMLIASGDYRPRGGWAPIILAFGAQCCLLYWFAALGSLLGKLLPLQLAGLAGAVLSILVLFRLTSNGSAEPRFSLLGDMGATVSQIGVAFNLSHLSWQIAVLLLSATALARLPVGMRRGLATPTRVGYLTAAGVTASAVVLVQLVGGGPLVQKEARPELCAGNGFRLCIYPEHQRYAEPVLAFLDESVAALRANGYDRLLAAQYVEGNRRYSGKAGDRPGIVVVQSIDVDYKNDPTLIVADLFTPTWCAAIHDPDEPPPDRYWEDAALLEETFLAFAPIEGGPASPPLTPAQVDETHARWAKCLLE